MADGADGADGADAARRVAAAGRVVVKIGSSLLLANGRLRRAWLGRLAGDAAALAASGRGLLIVTSGAVGLGRKTFGAPRGLAERQAAAAVGQVRLAEAWRRALARAGLESAQVLLTPGDTEDRRRHLNARATLEALLGRGIVPVINENDTVATEELKFGDNDRLAARVAQLVSADLLVVLSDVDGLYDRDPQRFPDARHIAEIRKVTPAVEAMAGGPGSALGTGGMASKLAAARIALAAGTTMAITDGRAPGALGGFLAGARASWFLPALEPLTARKAWIAATVAPRGTLNLDAGAVAALGKGRSLLAVGATALEGRFERGDPVRLVGPEGGLLGIGLVNYSAREAALILGRHSKDIPALLGYEGPDTLVHRDNLVRQGAADDARTQDAECRQMTI